MFLSREATIARNYRAQRLIRMGEWLEEHGDALICAFDLLDSAHDVLLDSDPDEAYTALELAGAMMSAPLRCQMQALTKLRVGNWDVKRGEDVTLYQEYAEEGKKYQVLLTSPADSVD